MSLPIPDLDDRRFQDLVDEAKRMIPQLVPEWTNHNVADPGVALIELFAWMSEQVIYRLNQVPEKLYVEFLNLLGTEPFPATSARAAVTFWLSDVPNTPALVPAGTEITTAEGGVVFATLTDLRIIQPELLAAFTAVGESSYVDALAALNYAQDSVACFRSNPVAADDSLLLGFDVSLANQMLVLQIETAGRGIGVNPDDVPIVWEAWTGEHWVATTVIEDTTGGLNRPGILRIVVPSAHEPLVVSGTRAHWVRVRLVNPRNDQPTFSTSPRIASIEASCLGGTVMAEHAVTIPGESIGTSDGTAGQRFALRNSPVLRRADGEHVVITIGDRQQLWTEVDDFANSDAGDRHVVFEDASGAIRFGPTVRYADGSTMQHGAIPAFGAEIAISRYRTGGGAIGNLPAGTLTNLRQSVAYVSRVENLVAARGGVDAETIDEVKIRGPRSLRTGQRAVTPTDYEQLALESTPRVARALCLPPENLADPLQLLIVPGNDVAPETFTLDDFALTDDLFTTVSEHLDERRLIGTSVRLTAPYFQGVSVVARVRAAAGRAPAAVSARVTSAIATYLSPLSGGHGSTGWPFGAELSTAGLTVVIEGLPGVDTVDELVLFEFDLRNEQRLGDPVQTIALDPGALFLSGRTQVVVR